MPRLRRGNAANVQAVAITSSLTIEMPSLLVSLIPCFYGATEGAFSTVGT